MTDPDPSINIEDLAEVGVYPSAAEAHEHGLVILAMRKPCWVLENGGGFGLFTETADLSAIRSEIQAYEAESLFPPPRRMPDDEPFRFSAGWAALAIWAVALIASFVWQIEHPSWTERGCSSSIGLVERGEWWRPVTAMFLHSDTPHLAGNLLGGAFFGTLVARSIGSLRAWPMILASGALGNTFTSLANWPEPFESVGASTAVFGALGILSGLGFASLLRHRLHLTPARVAAPVLGGVIVLGLMGGGAPDGRTDVLGHVLGFATGLVFGFLTGRLSPAGASVSGTVTEGHGGRI
jgi:membrane associated rhomboid family serine protease